MIFFRFRFLQQQKVEIIIINHIFFVGNLESFHPQGEEENSIG